MSMPTEIASLAAHALDAVPRAVFVVDSLRPGRPNTYVNAAYSAVTGFDVEEAVAAGFDALSIFANPEEIAALDAGFDVSASKCVQLRRRDGTTVSMRLELRRISNGSADRIVGLLESGGPSPEPGRDKDAFWSWLSHELRSPLNACVMWADVVALSPQPDKLAKAVDAIKRNLARQARLIGELSDAAKVGSGGLEVRGEPLDLVALVRRELPAWEASAAAKQIQLQNRIEVAAAPVVGDPVRLAQALGHVLDSSIGSTPPAGRVDLRIFTADGACVVEVTDPGAPLSPEDAANLPVPLWRGTSTARARSGVGLGLAVAHHLVTKHGGSLSATSANAGARFELTVPLATNDVGKAAVAKMDRKDL